MALPDTYSYITKIEDRFSRRILDYIDQKITTTPKMETVIQISDELGYAPAAILSYINRSGVGIVTTKHGTTVRSDLWTELDEWVDILQQ